MLFCCFNSKDTDEWSLKKNAIDKNVILKKIEAYLNFSYMEAFGFRLNNWRHGEKGRERALILWHFLKKNLTPNQSDLSKINTEIQNTIRNSTDKQYSLRTFWTTDVYKKNEQNLKWLYELCQKLVSDRESNIPVINQTKKIDAFSLSKEDGITLNAFKRSCEHNIQKKQGYYCFDEFLTREKFDNIHDKCRKSGVVNHYPIRLKLSLIKHYINNIFRLPEFGNGFLAFECFWHLLTIAKSNIQYNQKNNLQNVFCSAWNFKKAYKAKRLHLKELEKKPQVNEKSIAALKNLLKEEDDYFSGSQNTVENTQVNEIKIHHKGSNPHPDYDNL